MRCDCVRFCADLWPKTRPNWNRKDCALEQIKSKQIVNKSEIISNSRTKIPDYIYQYISHLYICILCICVCCKLGGIPIPFGHLHLTIQANRSGLSTTFDVASTCIELWNRIVYYAGQLTYRYHVGRVRGWGAVYAPLLWPHLSWPFPRAKLMSINWFQMP